jgi:bifunctional non-homologous end joining protein LigD
MAIKESQSAAEAVEVSHPDKVFFPEPGITKGEVFDYYRRIADRLLPYLRNRPVTLELLPEGVGEGKPHFWQKNTPASYPRWIPRIKLPSQQGKQVPYALVNNLPTLLYLVNQKALTFHVWLSRTENLDRPDFVLFDLDPGLASFADVVAVARKLRSLLDADGRPAFVKTSGKSGLHILVPWRSRRGYDEARAWAYEVAGRVVEALPEQATVELRKARRGQRVFVDVTENARGRHVVPPYVLRATPAASVSTPLTWRDVTPRLDPLAFTLRTIFRRLGRQKKDPFEPLRRAFERK